MINYDLITKYYNTGNLSKFSRSLRDLEYDDMLTLLEYGVMYYGLKRNEYLQDIKSVIIRNKTRRF